MAQAVPFQNSAKVDGTAKAVPFQNGNARV
jgi:hypothetical protein